MGYVVRWPLYGGHVNARDYPSNQLVLSDIEVVLRETLSTSLSIDQKSYNVRLSPSLPSVQYKIPPWDSFIVFVVFIKDYSAVLVIPDLYERTYVKDLIDILLLKMGFKQICVQQASLTPPPLSLHFPIPETFHFRRSD